uniref:NADH-ubiquinone oxidoreductase chain 3 n=1 Tax=Dicrocoelium chinensis TaxID=483157 RepID=A0A096XCC0_DICCN|nr:NADH dehydrogenase subunit 3 [Dicrocoelium chinensis]AHG06503.1 NADH dehydrogenase subunit 3 [Dicrocoelium chinensis]
MVVVACVAFLYSFLFLVLCIYFSFLCHVDRSISNSSARVWISVYECGYMLGRHIYNKFGDTYLNLLVFYVIFDVEVSLVLNIPLEGVWYKSLSCFMHFLLMLAAGLYFEIRKGYIS